MSRWRTWLAVVGLMQTMTLGGGSAHADAPVPWNPDASWAADALLNQALAAEAWAMLPGLAPVATGAAPVVLTAAQRQTLWLRGSFAEAAMAAADQAAPASDLSKKLAAAAPVGGPNVASEDAVAKTFAEAGSGPLWHQFARLLGSKPPHCQLPGKLLERYSELQLKTQTLGQAPTSEEVLGQVRGAPTAEVRCLAFTLMTRSGATKADPLPLFEALRVGESPLARELAVIALTATRLIQTERYGEALGCLNELTDLDASFRLPYDLIQRVYSARQKGGGAVALSGP